MSLKQPPLPTRISEAAEGGGIAQLLMCLCHDHPRQELLKETYQLMEMKKLLRGYGIRNFNPSSNCQVMVSGSLPLTFETSS